MYEFKNTNENFSLSRWHPRPHIAWTITEKTSLVHYIQAILKLNLKKVTIMKKKKNMKFNQVKVKMVVL